MIDLKIDHFEAARANLRGKTLVTPLIRAGAALTPGGNPIYLKAENLQPSGSFKLRGAYNCLANLSQPERAAGVIAYSTGNHAQTVAMAATQMGIKATIVMSPDAPAFKVEATRRYGATVIMSEPSSIARRELAEKLARREGLYLVPPYDHPAVLAGQGTIGLELLEQMPYMAAVFVPIGGGGLIAGIAAAIKQASPQIRLIGVEPEWENDAWQSFQTGQRVSLPTASQSIADAIRVQTLGNLTYPLIQTYVDDIVTVSEAQIAAATLAIFAEKRLVVEPAGALGLAAALVYSAELPAERPVIAIASGGNILLETLSGLQTRFPSANI